MDSHKHTHYADLQELDGERGDGKIDISIQSGIHNPEEYEIQCSGRRTFIKALAGCVIAATSSSLLHCGESAGDDSSDISATLDDDTQSSGGDDAQGEADVGADLAADQIEPGSIGATLVLTNGNILTLDANNTVVQAIAVQDDRILSVGTSDTIAGLINAGTEVIDLKGQTVTPGLVDSHIHVMYYGRQFWDGYVNIRYPEVQSKEDLLSRVAEAASNTPAGEWICGNQGFLLSLSETPDRWELDDVAHDNPVYLRHSSGQYVTVNSAALKMAGIDAATPNPYGGQIQKDPGTGEPTGLLFHYPAENLVGKLAKGYGDRTDEECLEDIRRGQTVCLRSGYTSGQDVILGTVRDMEMYQGLADMNELKMRIYMMKYVSSEQVGATLLNQVKPIQSDLVTFGGWKLAADGGVAAGTLLMYDSSLPAAMNSYIYHDQETLNKLVSMFHKQGHQVAIHVGGDRGIDMVINAIEAALNETPRDNHRHRIEHLLFPTPDALKRIRDLGIVVSLQPQWIAFHADGFRAMTNDQTMENLLPLRTMLDLGINVAFGCDVPATIFDEPCWAFHGAIIRKTSTGYVANESQRISQLEALRCHTMGSAYAAFDENRKGSLEKGKLADLVVWSHDLLTMPLTELKNFKATITIAGGKVVTSQ